MRPVKEAGVASVRLIRIMALTDAVAVVIFTGLELPSLIAQWQWIPAWWSLAVIGVVLLPGVVLLGAAILGPLALVRSLLTLIAAGYLAALATLPLVLAGRTVPAPLGTPWILGIAAVGTAAAAIAWRPALAWGAVAAVSVMTGLDRVVASSTAIFDVAYQDAVYALMFDSLFTALGLALRRAARLQDSAAADADAEARSASIAEARGRERGRVETLVHDTVLVALLGSSRGAPADAVAAAARRALDQIEGMVDLGQPESVDPVTGVWALQSVVTELDPDAVFGYDLDRSEPLPGDVVGAVSEAMAEALRNSVQHAGARVHRAVHVTMLEERLEVTVIDDGAGFDPDAVGPARLGIAVSMTGRMRSVPGGDAIVVSRIGTGTRVVLRWDEATA